MDRRLRFLSGALLIERAEFWEKFPYLQVLNPAVVFFAWFFSLVCLFVSISWKVEPDYISGFAMRCFLVCFWVAGWFWRYSQRSTHKFKPGNPAKTQTNHAPPKNLSNAKTS